ncbi:MAG: relaxase/mobilization nuclease domain-containing protein [Microcystaceae cyanobacterium]
MIGKQIKGTSFRGVLNYLHAKEGSRCIGGNMAGKTPRTLAAEFRVARELNPRLNRAVYHASLSLPKTERLDDERWSAIADDYVRGMGFEGSQYVIYRHTDKEHDHIHIVASRIRLSDGSTVSDSWDYRWSEKLIRELEKKYQLTPAPSSKEILRRGQTTGEVRQLRRTGEESVRLKLQSILEEATANPLTMPQLIDRLKDGGVDARVSYTRTGKVKGISYQLDGMAFSGTHLGKAYTFPGLQKYRGVIYDKSQESEIQAASAHEPAKQPLQTVTPEPVAPPPEEQADRSLELKKQFYRLKYEELARRVRHNRGFENRPTEEVDIGVAMFILAESEDHNDVGRVLTQSYLAQEWKGSLSEEEYKAKLVDYIHQTYELAVEYHQKTARETARAARVLLNNFGKQQPDGSLVFEGRRWRFTQQDEVVTITVKEDNREILRVEGERPVLFKPKAQERKDLTELRQKVAQDLQHSQPSQRQQQGGELSP